MIGGYKSTPGLRFNIKSNITYRSILGNILYRMAVYPHCVRVIAILKHESVEIFFGIFQSPDIAAFYNLFFPYNVWCDKLFRGYIIRIIQ